jgi:hypothetical protein
MQGPVESFRMSFWWVLGYVVAVAISVTAAWILVVFFVFNVSYHLLIGGVVAIGAGEVIAALLVWFFVTGIKVYAGPAGLRGHTFWGRSRKFAWSDIRSVRPINILGMKYLRVFPGEPGAPLWIPLFMATPARFGFVVRQYGGPEHPLAVALQDEAI